MKRGKGLRRTSFIRRKRMTRPARKPVDLAGEALLREYRESHRRCAVCHWRDDMGGRWLELHHIMGRFRRGVYEPRNVVMVCNLDHRGFHDGGSRRLDLGHILTAKAEEDGELDLEYLAWLRHKSKDWLVPQPLPSWVMEERRKHAVRRA